MYNILEIEIDDPWETLIFFWGGGQVTTKLIFLNI